MNLPDRAKKIVLQPKQEWEVIATESATTAQLYTSYVIPLAAIGPIASIIGMSLIGISVPFIGTYQVPIGAAITHSILSYVLTLVGIFVLALIIDALAPSFSGQKNQMQALKVATYSCTAAWLGGIFSLIPSISILAIIPGIYSLYLLYVGLPVLMKSPQDKALVYTVVVVIAAILIFLVIGAVSSALVSYYPVPTFQF
ncbi:MAG: Yip1 family protein [Bacteroidota bacterium]